MNELTTHRTFESTSANGAMRLRPLEPIILGCLLAGFGTSAEYSREWGGSLLRHSCVEQTTAGARVDLPQSAGGAIGELRRLSGLTWNQLARIFNVSRRSLHFWASGKAMAPNNEEHLQRVLSVVRKTDRGSAKENRAALLGAQEDGTLPFDLLVAGDYERAFSLLGTSEARRVALPKLSDEARTLRAPRPPEELVGALQNRIHPTSGRVRAAKAIAVARRK